MLSLRANPGAVRAAALALAAAIGMTAARSPQTTILLCVGLAAFVITLRSLLTGLVIFTVATFPSNLPQALSFGATVAKPLGVVVVVSWLFSLLHDRETPFLLRDAPAVAWVSVALVGWATLSVAWAPDPGAAAAAAARIGQVVLLLFVTYSAVKTSRDLLIMAAAFVVAASATSSYALVNGQTVAGRLTGGIQNPNFLAAGIVAAVAIGAFMLATPLRPPVRAALVGLLAINVVAFVAAGSRGGTVAAGAALVTAIVVSGPLRTRAVATALMVAAIGIGYYSLVGPSNVSSRIGDISLQASSGRADLWRIALRVGADHPLAGIGLANFPVVEYRYFQSTTNLLDPSVIQRHGGQLVVHNTYLELFAELGVVGLALFIALIVLAVGGTLPLIRDAGAHSPNLRPTLGRGLLVGLCGLLVNFTFDSGQYEKQLWLLLGLVVAAGVRRSRAGEPVPDALETRSAAVT